MRTLGVAPEPVLSRARALGGQASVEVDHQQRLVDGIEDEPQVSVLGGELAGALLHSVFEAFVGGAQLLGGRAQCLVALLEREVGISELVSFLLQLGDQLRVAE